MGGPYDTPGLREAEFRRVYDEHMSALWRYVSARTPGHFDIGEIVSEVFSVAWRRFDKLEGARSERAWLFGVARRVLSNHRRGDARRGRLLSRMAAQPAAWPEPSGSTFASRVEAALGRLRPKEREALMLTVIDQLASALAAFRLGKAHLPPLGYDMRLPRDRFRVAGRLRVGDRHNRWHRDLPEPRRRCDLDPPGPPVAGLWMLSSPRGGLLPRSRMGRHEHDSASRQHRLGRQLDRGEPPAPSAGSLMGIGAS